jgi:hypothetical protein
VRYEFRVTGEKIYAAYGLPEFPQLESKTVTRDACLLKIPYDEWRSEEIEEIKEIKGIEN